MTTEHQAIQAAPETGKPDLEALKDQAAKSFRQGRVTVLTKEAHLAYVGALQRAFPDRKVAKVAHVAFFDDPNLPIIFVSSDPGTSPEQCANILLTAARTLKNSEVTETPIDKKEESSS